MGQHQHRAHRNPFQACSEPSSSSTSRNVILMQQGKFASRFKTLFASLHPSLPAPGPSAAGGGGEEGEYRADAVTSGRGGKKSRIAKILLEKEKPYLREHRSPRSTAGGRGAGRTAPSGAAQGCGGTDGAGKRVWCRTGEGQPYRDLSEPPMGDSVKPPRPSPPAARGRGEKRCLLSTFIPRRPPPPRSTSCRQGPARPAHTETHRNGA